VIDRSRRSLKLYEEWLASAADGPGMSRGLMRRERAAFAAGGAGLVAGIALRPNKNRPVFRYHRIPVMPA
jgi:hypothetical protein